MYLCRLELIGAVGVRPQRLLESGDAGSVLDLALRLAIEKDVAAYREKTCRCRNVTADSELMSGRCSRG